MFVVFDMDGVLVDSEVHWRAVETQFLAGLVGRWTDADQRRILGMSAYDVHRLLVAEYGLKATAEEYFSHYRDLAGVIYGERSSLIPGATDCISELLADGATLGVASSSPHSWIDIVLDRFDLRRSFASITSSDDVGGRGKPAPDIYTAAAARLGCEPADAVAIEDTEKGVQSARSAGLACVGFRNGFNPEQDLAGANAIAEGFGAISAEMLRGIIMR